MYNFDGKVKTCIRSSDYLGSIQDSSIEDILQNDKSVENRINMLNHQPAPRCSPCYELEKNTKNFNVISDRVYYLKELKHIDKNLYTKPDNFHLSKIDVRWTNLCNLSCIYCGPIFSSKWASELGVQQNYPTEQQQGNLKNYIFSNITNLKNVYLAGGEPLLMKENLLLLQELHSKNPDVHIRINTNLSKTGTKIFDLLTEFKNVHWIVSFETLAEEFEYVRYGNSWQDFVENLNIVSKLDHKISFNMLYFSLNYKSIFDAVDFLFDSGYHPNSLIIGPLLRPDNLNVRHLPNGMLNSAREIIKERLNQKPGFLYENGLKNILSYINAPFDRKPELIVSALSTLDKRRSLDSRKIFKTFYNELEGK